MLSNFNIPLTKAGQLIAERLIDTRLREIELMQDLTDKQMLGPSTRIAEPPIWELGHVGWFQDRWILQNLDNRAPTDEKADRLYDSFNIPNAARWDLYFPSRGQTFEYITDILEQIIARLEARDPTEKEVYFYNLVLNHEEMHSETMHHIRHTFGYPAPKFSVLWGDAEAVEIDEAFEPYDVEIPGCEYMLGGLPGQGFVFDNEKWAHPVNIDAFKISATPVTFAEYRQFVDEGGYQNESFWGEEGWVWRIKSDQDQPAYWKQGLNGQWLWRWFDQWQPIKPNFPMVHVNWYEANAFCNWAGRRLPTEAEWELAASGADGIEKRLYPWGNDVPQPNLANLNSFTAGVVDVRAFPQGDSFFGLRQMIGNVWEWTADTFDAFPGYVIDPYDTYSEPSFGQQKVLRGGCWATRPQVIRNTFRNFYTPDRNNIFAGFRTVATS